MLQQDASEDFVIATGGIIPCPHYRWSARNWGRPAFEGTAERVFPSRQRAVMMPPQSAPASVMRIIRSISAPPKLETL